MKLETMTPAGRRAFTYTLAAVAESPNELGDFDLAAHFAVCQNASAGDTHGNWVFSGGVFTWLDAARPYPMTPDDIAREIGQG